MQPDSVTFVGVANACASLVALEESRCAREQIIQSGWDSDVFVENSLVDIYAKCGSMEDAKRVFNEMPLRDLPCMGMIRKLLYILNRSVKKVYSQMISPLFVFCQPVAMQVWCMKACAFMLQ